MSLISDVLSWKRHESPTLCIHSASQQKKAVNCSVCHWESRGCYHDDWAEAVTIGYCSSNARLITVLVGMFASDSLVFPTILALVRCAILSSSRLASSLLALSPSEVAMGGPLREIGCGRWIVTIWTGGGVQVFVIGDDFAWQRHKSLPPCIHSGLTTAESSELSVAVWGCRNAITTDVRADCATGGCRLSRTRHIAVDMFASFSWLFLIFTILGLRPVLRVEHLNIALGNYELLDVNGMHACNLDQSPSSTSGFQILLWFFVCLRILQESILLVGNLPMESSLTRLMQSKVDDNRMSTTLIKAE